MADVLDPASISGVQKTAIFLLTMGEEYTLKVFERMSDEAISEIGVAMSRIDHITPEMLKSATVRRGVKSPSQKESVTLQIDTDVLNWFKAKGTSYQNQINALLRAYMEAHQ